MVRHPPFTSSFSRILTLLPGIVHGEIKYPTSLLREFNPDDDIQCMTSRLRTQFRFSLPNVDPIFFFTRSVLACAVPSLP